MQLTDEQLEIIYLSQKMKPGEILKIEACAGSGKTFTLAQIAYANPHKSFLYLAFNKAVVLEAQKKFPSNVTIMTTHSLAYREIVMQFFKDRQIVGQLRPVDLKEIFPDKNYKDLYILLTSFHNFLQSDIPRAPNADIARIVNAIESNKLPMTHDYYLKLYQVYQNKRIAQFDVLLLDEAQDTNDVTISIFRDNPCAKILVGDSNQAIYGFRGAINALKKVRADYVAYLSYSFRSTQDILDIANYFVKTYKQDNYIPMKAFTKQQDADCKLETSAIITRTNAALIEQIDNIEPKFLSHYNLIRDPRSIFTTPLSIFNFINEKRENIAPQDAYIKTFKDLNSLEDYADTCNDKELLFSIEMAKKYKNKLFKLYEIGKQIYQNQKATVVLTNAHQSKGLEWDYVNLCSDFPSLLREKARTVSLVQGKNTHEITNQTHQILLDPESCLIQELNLYYVALTRAKNTLSDLTENKQEYLSVTEDCISHERLFVDAFTQYKSEAKAIASKKTKKAREKVSKGIAQRYAHTKFKTS